MKTDNMFYKKLKTYKAKDLHPDCEVIKKKKLEKADKERKATEKAFRMVERGRRIVAAYTALIAFLLGVLVGILGYTGYVAYTAPERGETMTMGAE